MKKQYFENLTSPLSYLPDAPQPTLAPSKTIGL